MGFISEDNMKSPPMRRSTPPQSIFKKNPKSTIACLFKACCYCAIFITAATALSTCTSWIQHVQLYSLRRRCPRLWKGVRKLSSAHKSYWFFFNFHLCFSFFSFELRVNLTFSGFWSFLLRWNFRKPFAERRKYTNQHAFKPNNSARQSTQHTVL